MTHHLDTVTEGVNNPEIKKIIENLSASEKDVFLEKMLNTFVQFIYINGHTCYYEGNFEWNNNIYKISTMATNHGQWFSLKATETVKKIINTHEYFGAVWIDS